MKLIKVGDYYCEICKKDIVARVWANNPDLVMKHKGDAIYWIKNYHWYDNHYNCAVCGKWIPSGERELISEKDLTVPVHKNYNFTDRHGLMRVHKKCAEKLA